MPYITSLVKTLNDTFVAHKPQPNKKMQGTNAQMDSSEVKKNPATPYVTMRAAPILTQQAVRLGAM